MLSGSPKHLAVLNAVAERAGWDTPAPSGVFRGLAPTIAVAAPAVLNAICAATAKRVRDLPLKNQSLTKA